MVAVSWLLEGDISGNAEAVASSVSLFIVFVVQ